MLYNKSIKNLKKKINKSRKFNKERLLVYFQFSLENKGNSLQKKNAYNKKK